MKHAILLDSKITNKEYNEWVEADIAFWKRHIGITPEYIQIRTDYREYPTYIDAKGHTRPSDKYLQSLNDQVTAKYGHFDIDFVVVMIHEDNWLSDTDDTDGIWGTNYSYIFGNQCLDYCRWDKDNPANTFGVAYHERHHSFDAIIKQELGIDIEPILNVLHQRYDHCITHGNCDDWKYIRYKENTKSLQVMKPYLQQAFKKRRERHYEEIMNLQNQVIALAKQVIYWIKKKQNAKYGLLR